MKTQNNKKDISLMRVRWLPQGEAVLYIKLDYNQQYKTLHHNERTQVKKEKKKKKKNGENGRKKKG